MPNFVLGVVVGIAFSAFFMTALPSRSQHCEKTSGDSFWSHKKEVVPCPTK